MLFKAIRLDKITKEVTIGRREGGLNTELGGISVLRVWKENDSTANDTEKTWLQRKLEN